MAISTKVTTYFRAEAWVFGRYLAHFANMPLDKASAAGADWLANIGPLTSAHTTALRNLRMAFPNETENWRKEVARAAWAEIGRTAAELPHLPTLDPFGERVEWVGLERLDAIRDAKRGIVFISGHFSNWELMPMSIARRGAACAMTYRPANNPIIDQRILSIRQAYGAQLQAAKGVEGGMGLMRSLSRSVSVALMNDQKYNEGVAAPLFGYNCMTADGPARLAHRFRTALQPMSVRRMAGARFRITVHEPIALDHDAPMETEIPGAVVRVNAFVEEVVRAAPEQWFWVHKRWPVEAWKKAGVM